MTAFAEFERRSASMTEVLSTHLSMGDGEAQEVAAKLLGSYRTAKAFSKLEAEDKRPAGDIAAIEKAARAIKTARVAIESVGYHGSKTMGRALEDLFQDPTAELGTFLWPSSSLRELDLLAGHLQRLQSVLEEAAQKVDPSAMSLGSDLGEGPEFETFMGHKKRRVEDAKHLTRKLASLYFKKTGKIPQVWTDPHSPGNPAYSPFFDLTKAAFAAFEITASAEGCAREVCKEFSSEKS